MKIAKETVNGAKSLYLKDVYLPWIDDDIATKCFIKFWFANNKAGNLRKLSYLISNKKSTYNDLMSIALSRLIITKRSGASLAADVSHSRPHRVIDKK